MVHQVKFPDYKQLPFKINDINIALISHFHLDHCGGLPIFS